MRIKSISLEPFGCFSDLRLDFDPGKGFHVIYGLNEAGKSTLLRALVNLFYGIPHKSADSHRFKGPELKIAAVLLDREGRELHYSRRKGNKDTLLDRDSRPLQEELADLYLGALPGPVYQSMFALDHAALREGGQQLLESGGELEESLFSAAYGLTGLHRTLEDLEKEAQALYNPRGRASALKRAVADYRESQKAVREHSLEPRVWEQLERDHQELKERLAGLREKRKDLNIALSRGKRIFNCRGDLVRREQILEELAALAGIKYIGSEEAEQRKTLSTALEDLARRRKEAEDRARKHRTSLGTLAVNPALLEREARISRLAEQLAAFREGRENYPRVIQDIRRLEQEMRELLQEIDPAACELGDIDRYRLPLKSREALKALGRAYPLVEEKESSLARQLRKNEQDLEQYRQAIEDIGVDAADKDRLEQALKNGREHRYLEKKREELQADIETRENGLAASLHALPLTDCTISELARMAPPLAETIRRFEGMLDGNRETIDQLKQQLEQGREQEILLVAGLAQLERSAPLPTREELEGARAERDAGWNSIRDLLQGRTPAPPAQTGGPLRLAGDYEQKVAAADSVADVMISSSEALVKKQSYLDQVSRLQQEAREAEGKLSRLETEKAGIEADWQQVWQDTGITPLSPAEMREWMAAREQILDEGRTIESLRRERQQIQEKLDPVKAQLIATLPPGEAKDPSSLNLSGLLERAEEEALSINRRLNEKAELEGSLKTCRERLAALRNEKKEVDREIGEWRDSWEQAIRALPEPAGKDPAVVLVYLEKLDQLFAISREHRGKQAEEALIRQNQEGFTAAVDTLKEELAREDPRPADEALSGLDQEVRQARETQKEKEQRQNQLQQEEETLRDLDDAIKRTEAELQGLMEKKGITSLQEMEEAERQSHRQRELEKELAPLEQRLLDQAEGLSLEELAREAAGTGVDENKIQMDETEAELNDLEAELEEANQAFGALDAEYNRLARGGSAEAGSAALERGFQAAAIEGILEEYIQTRLAASLLRRAMEEHRRSSQQFMVEQAGQALATITGGSFSGITVAYDKNDRAFLAGLRPTRELVTVEGMSDGTKDQVYLALRLAFLEKYLQEHPPVPVILDDIFINYDDRRAGHTLQLLLQLSRKTQVLFFTHHLALKGLAGELGEEQVDFIDL